MSHQEIRITWLIRIFCYLIAWEDVVCESRGIISPCFDDCGAWHCAGTDRRCLRWRLSESGGVALRGIRTGGQGERACYTDGCTVPDLFHDQTGDGCGDHDAVGTGRSGAAGSGALVYSVVSGQAGGTGRRTGAGAGGNHHPAPAEHDLRHSVSGVWQRVPAADEPVL